MRFLRLALVGVAACASAGKDNPGQDPDAANGDGKPIDGTMMPDGPNPDMTVMTTLSQVVSTTNAMSNSVVCNSGENSWYRVIQLADHNITGAFNVQSVTFGVQEALGAPAVQIKIGTYNVAPGTTLNTAQITPVNSATTNAANQTNPGGNVTVPITGVIPAGSRMIVEIYKPGANTAGQYFVIGASNAGETKTGYVRAPTCNDAGGAPMTQPVTPATAGRPSAQLNIVVTGTY